MSMEATLDLGDYVLDYATLNFLFTTLEDATGAPIILAGGPVISVYKGSATGTEKTSGEAYVTLDIDFDGVTGLNHVLIDLSADAFFTAGEDYSVVLTTGTVNSISKVGVVLAHFSIENRSQQATNTAILADTDTLGSPAGASHAADAAAIKAQTAEIETDTGELGSAVGADLATDIAAIKTQTDELGSAVGADLSTDIAAIKSQTADIETDTGELGAAVGANLSADIAAIKTQTDELGSAAGADLATDIAAIKSQVVDIETDTGEIGTGGAGLDDIGGFSTAAKAEINAEAKDVLVTDTQVEQVQGAPAATASLATMIGYLFQAWRNKSTQTDTLHTILLDNESTAASKSTVSDDGTTATRGERVTGA